MMTPAVLTTYQSPEHLQEESVGRGVAGHFGEDGHKKTKNEDSQNSRQKQDLVKHFSDSFGQTGSLEQTTMA